LTPDGTISISSNLKKSDAFARLGTDAVIVEKVMKKPVKLIRVTTVPLSFDKLLTGQLKYMTEHGFDVFMVSSGASNTANISQRERSEFVQVEMTRTISPFKDLVSLYKLTGVLKRIRPAIVHTHTPKAGLLGMLAAKFAGVPIRLHTVAGLPLMETTGVKRQILELVEKLTYTCAVKVYPNSQNLNQFIKRKGFCPPAKLKVLGNGSSNGIDTRYFNLNSDLEATANELKSEYNINPSDFVFIFIGRVVKDKGIQELVQAFNMLSKAFTNIKLLIVGPYESKLDPVSEETTESIDNNTNIIHVGYQADVRPYLAISSALAFPSYREGFPNVPMQAGCFNLPCIVTDINGCNEIIENEENGLIIPPKDAVALHDAMRQLMVDNVLYTKLKGNARKMIVERYEQNHFWSLLLDEYKEQLNKHGLIL